MNCGVLHNGIEGIWYPFAPLTKKGQSLKHKTSNFDWVYAKGAHIEKII